MATKFERFLNSGETICVHCENSSVIEGSCRCEACSKICARCNIQPRDHNYYCIGCNIICIVCKNLKEKGIYCTECFVKFVKNEN